jgi:hypothetical protein
MQEKNIIYEETLYVLWESFCRHKRVTQDGRLKGLFAGELNKFDGPDFQGAEFQLDGKIFRGDVEIHRKFEDWFLHGHHLDHRYDKVVLHLVWFKKNKTLIPINNSKKLGIPTISFQNFPIVTRDAKYIKKCNLPLNRRNYFFKKVKEMALKRFLNKAKQMRLLNLSFGYDQSLYLMILRTLGSPHNSNNFERLAALLPWDKVQNFKRTQHPTAEIMLALYLGYSGLLKKRTYLKPLTQTAIQLQTFFKFDPMPTQVWHLAGQRPANSPINRLLGLAHFMYQFSSPSLYQSIKERIVCRLRFEKLYDDICELLTPRFSLWAKKVLMNNSCRETKFWGKTILTEIIGNVILPFFYNESLNNISFGFSAYLEEFFLFLPYTNRYGVLKEFDSWLELRSTNQNKFYLNQALLFLLSRYCQGGYCNNCPLGRNQEN